MQEQTSTTPTTTTSPPPSDPDIEALRRDLMAAVPDVENVHHVHAWMLTDERPLMTLHANLRAGADHHRALSAIRDFLEAQYGVGHATIQIEPPGGMGGERMAAEESGKASAAD